MKPDEMIIPINETLKTIKERRSIRAFAKEEIHGGAVKGETAL